MCLPAFAHQWPKAERELEKPQLPPEMPVKGSRQNVITRSGLPWSNILLYVFTIIVWWPCETFSLLVYLPHRGQGVERSRRLVEMSGTSLEVSERVIHLSQWDSQINQCWKRRDAWQPCWTIRWCVPCVISLQYWRSLLRKISHRFPSRPIPVLAAVMMWVRLQSQRYGEERIFHWSASIWEWLA